ncbi:MAG: hypothetical protein OXU50_02675, partial [Gammaproteobacteria bacterium]|nr:hypothetical protein [Gammaproteobacteria bacterium]
MTVRSVRAFIKENHPETGMIERRGVTKAEPEGVALCQQTVLPQTGAAPVVEKLDSGLSGLRRRRRGQRQAKQQQGKNSQCHAHGTTVIKCNYYFRSRRRPTRAVKPTDYNPSAAVCLFISGLIAFALGSIGATIGIGS